MSEFVTLSRRADAGDEATEIDGLAPDRLASMTALETASLPAWIGGRAARLGDVFDVRGSG